MVGVRLPAFFKVFSADSDSTSTKLPYTEFSYPDRVTVRDIRHSNTWPMVLERCAESSSFYFREGWIQFKTDNSLQRGDYMFFEYIGEGLFTIKILGPDSCKKNLDNIDEVIQNEAAGDRGEETNNNRVAQIIEEAPKDEKEDNDEFENFVYVEAPMTRKRCRRLVRREPANRDDQVEVELDHGDEAGPWWEDKEDDST